MNIDVQTVKKIIREELPGLVKSDSEIRQLIVQLSREQAELQADKVEVVMDSRFDRLLEDLRKDREEQTRKWDKNQEELRQLREEQNKKWEENREELRQLRDEQNKKCRSLRLSLFRYYRRGDVAFWGQFGRILAAAKMLER